ncbi:MAG TPA: ATP-binding protein, partial [Candidatus Synoicihabitans sp.]|nr:ATP-binding protein [Candidatus Synoicihabitans sp.]
MTPPDLEMNRRILIVDDGVGIHEDFRKILADKRRGGTSSADEAELFGPAASSATPTFELDSAHQGQEGLEMVKRARAAGRPYAMVFMDVRMPPGWDGIETTARIWEVDPDLQVVICTAYSDYSWTEMEKKLGHSDRLLILKKPFDNVEALQLATSLTEKWRLLQQAHRQVEQLEETVRAQTTNLRKSEERYRLITENADELIGLIDPHGHVLYRSPSFRHLLGYSAEELAALPVFAFVDAQDREALSALTRESIEKGTQRSCDVQVHRRDGSVVTLDLRCGPFRNASGVAEAALVVARDVTERRILEVQLRQAQKLESIGQLATGIAHEINTPTQFINDNVCFLRDAFADIHRLLSSYEELLKVAEVGQISPSELSAARALRDSINLEFLLQEIPRALGDTLDGVGRTATIVRAMRTFAHPGSAEKTLIDLQEMVEDALTMTRNEWRYVADATADIDPELPPIPVFPGELSQVLLNLIINATHTIAEKVSDRGHGKGAITITARRDGDVAELRIRDTGLGIPDKVRERVFDPFFTTKSVGKGTGQGLTLARSIIVKKHGGSLSFETVIGEGSTFIVRLPLGT